MSTPATALQPIEHLSGRPGGRKAGLIGMSLTLLPLAGGWLWADSLGKIFLVGMLLGVAGASFAVALPMASRWYPPEHQGLAMGLAGAGNSGTLFATLFAPRLANAFGWHAVFGLAIVPLVFALTVFVVYCRGFCGAGNFSGRLGPFSIERTEAGECVRDGAYSGS